MFCLDRTAWFSSKESFQIYLHRKSLFFPFLLLTLAGGCGARTEVVKDNVLKKIDTILGELDVKQKDIELGMKGLEEGIGGIRKAKILTKVKADRNRSQVGQ